MEFSEELQKKIKEVFDRAPVDGHYSKIWKGEGKEAFQDGILTLLDLLEVEIYGINY